MQAPLDYWYTACAASRLGARKPVAVRVLDVDLVLFRDRDGRATALQDRCVHRGVALSRGRCTEGRVECPYHGWQFDETGRCALIPSLLEEERIAEGVAVPSYPCEEKDGYVWVYMGRDRHAAPCPASPPGIPGFQSGRWVQGAMDSGHLWIRGIENNVDITHAAFAHPWAHQQWFSRMLRGLRPHAFEVRTREDGLVVFAPPTREKDDPIPASTPVRLEYTLPNRVTVSFKTGKSARFVIVLHFVPTGEGTCRLEWMNTRPLALGKRVVLRNRTPRVYRQDCALLESAQPAFEREGTAFERSVASDATTILARKIAELAIAGEWESKRGSLPERRIVRARG